MGFRRAGTNLKSESRHVRRASARAQRNARRRDLPSATSLNQCVHYRAFPDASNRTVVGFNVDTLYSMAQLDLSKEPMVHSVPARHRCRWPPALRGISLRPPAGDASCTDRQRALYGAGTFISESGAALSEGSARPLKHCLKRDSAPWTGTIRWPEWHSALTVMPHFSVQTRSVF
jgi:hypothetical protein